MRKHLSNLAILGCLWLAAGLGACDSSVKLKGSTHWVVGQRITLVRQHGGAFIDGDFSLTDSTGQTYQHNEEKLDYEWIDGSEIRFTVPQGIPAGTTTVTVGADGSDPYVFEVEVVRLFGVLDVSGGLAFYGLDDPEKHYASYQVGVGQGYVSLSWEGDRLIAVAATSGEIHFLEVTTDSLQPFAPSVELGIPLGRGALLDHGAVVASAEGVGYIVQRPNGELELDAWLETGAVSAVAAAPRHNRAVAAGVAGDATGPVNVMFRIDAFWSPPDLKEDEGVRIDGSLNGVTDVAMTPDGIFGIAVNNEDNTITAVAFDEVNPSPDTQALAGEGSGAWRLIAEAESQWLAVLRDKHVAIYTVETTGLVHSASVLADPRTGLPDTSQGPVDGGFAPGDRLYVLLADGAVSEIRVGSAAPAVSLLRDAQPNAGTALLIQP